MKFLCVSCDEQMKIKESQGPDEGSMTIIFECPGCGWEVGMLTNPYETQLVNALNVKIGQQGEESYFNEPEEKLSSSATIRWTPEAEKRIRRIPDFVREMARMGIEQYARDNGHDLVTKEVMIRARVERGM